MSQSEEKHQQTATDSAPLTGQSAGNHRWVVIGTGLLVIVGAVAGGWALLQSNTAKQVSVRSDRSGNDIADGRHTADGRQDAVYGHERMVALLKEIAEQTPAHPWLGSQEATLWRRRVASITSRDSTPRRVYALARLAIEELRLGEERRAIGHLSDARRLIHADSHEVPEELQATVIYGLVKAFLRLGETENCCQRNTPDSCLLPIRGSGIHTQQEGSRKAIEYLTELIETVPEDSDYQLKARWLLNIAYMTVDGYPQEVPEELLIPEEVFRSEEPFPRFVNIASRLDLDTFNVSGGVISDDFDNDGYLDLITSTYDTRGQIRFFRSNGDGTFVERTDEANLSGILGGLNLEQADYDNDGDLDILVLRGAWLVQGRHHPNSLLRNNGDGTFTDVTFEAGLGRKHLPTQTAAWADFDNDGNLDLFIGNEHTPGCRASSQLFRNCGDGSFLDVARQAGVENDSFTKGASWGDYNADRFPDLFVSNLGQPNRLYRNQQDGTFTDVAETLGVTQPRSSFPTWFWDFNNDGHLDLYVSAFNGGVGLVAASYVGQDVPVELACLYRGDGNGGFDEVARSHNLVRLNMPMGANFGDLDNDGYLDFYLGTGDVQFDQLMPNVMYHNRSGRSFSDVTTAGGFGHLQKGHAIAFADLDHDGDQDVFAQMGGGLASDEFGDALFENPGFDNHWIKIRLAGVNSNRCAVGARICLEVVDGPPKSQEEAGDQVETVRSIYSHVNSGGSFGANPLLQQIGLGQASKVRRLEVYWPATDRLQVFNDVEADQLIHITEGDESFRSVFLAASRFRANRSVVTSAAVRSQKTNAGIHTRAHRPGGTAARK